ncbi:PD-(D/E)XK nuclease family protein [Robiginitalea sp. SC105]|uniref:PD-(D/E)XK nuclease family protein n=1 Tax=Robiginitalea sp. SC105 TaxID=2762332 RepID=UPI001639A002|nr:PD-(D/E)XK nuclease family protein [Robiginitalea sp. SC105]MBC2838073.1 PD-(D/E)XK nuclease family protein [Robiginitalea sp. SC105]
MQSFLDSVLDDLPEWQADPTSFVFILPSKRAGFFLRSRMAQRAQKTFISPRIWSIEDFVADISGLRYAGQLHLIFRLYEAYLDQDGVENESFSDFAKWAPLLLQDFNEIDRYLVATDRLFETLAALKEIRNWTPDGTSTPMIDRQLAFWKNLRPVYTRFRTRLAEEGLGYQGMVYRRAAGSLPEYLRERGAANYVFVGFNALNTAESQLIQYMLEHSGARIYWDADPHYIENPLHDAGHFMRKHLREWPSLKGGLRGIQRHFGEPKKIELTGIPKSVTQAKFCGELLGRLHRKNPDTLDRTALVLGDETLLNPILHALPAGLPAVNVTMSYPIRNSPLAQLFDLLLDMRIEKGSSGWKVQQLMTLLGHPFLQGWFAGNGFDPRAARAMLIRENLFFADAATIGAMGFPKAIKDLLLPDGPLAPLPTAENLEDITLALKPIYQEAGDPLRLEYLFHFNKLFNQLIQLTSAYPFITDLKSLQLLFRQLLADEKVDFEGEPLEGLQVMGMLESRNLDYETVIITSVNEGILPSGKSNASFIPFDVKKEFGLPTYKEKDAVYTYHFYRLLQRAREIYICYNTEPDVLEGGEPSRFINQLRTDPLLGKQTQMKFAIPDTGVLQPGGRSIHKGPDLLKRLGELAVSGFSPTSLSRYISDPLLFYRRNVLGIPESDQLEETVAANTFGTVLHDALETLYLPLEGQLLDPQNLKELEARSSEVVDRAFRKHYLKDGKARGRNLIALQVLRQHLSLFLKGERLRARREQIRIIGVERKIRRELHVPGLGLPVWLKGTVDRIEEVDGRVRIIDYKTGQVDPSQLRISEWDSLRTDPDQAKAFQVLCYALLYQGESGIQELQAGIYSFKNMGAGYQWFGDKTTSYTADEAVDAARLEAFREVLHQLLLDVFNPTIPFEAVPR